MDTAWFKGRMIDIGISQRQLARAIGIDPSGVSLMLRGKRGMDVSEAGVVAKALGVPVEEVLRHAGVRGASVGLGAVPIIGWVNDQWDVIDEPGGVVEGCAGMGEGCVALRVQTREMFDGWTIGFKECAGVSLECVGRLCIVEVEDRPGRMLRAVRRGFSAGEYVLGGWWLERSGSVRLVRAAPVIWMRQ